MEISVAAQAVSLAGALALGVAVGLLYDLFRILRVRIPWRVMGGFLDLVFWLLVTAALFVYTVAVGDGRVRFFLVAAILGGAVAYFLLLSRWALKLGYLFADLLGLLWRLLTLPVTGLLAICKKIKKIAKNHFHYVRKWYRIRQIPKEMETGKRGGTGREIKKAGLLTKIVVLALLIGLSITLLDLRSQLQDAQSQKDALTAQVNAQTQVNADLSDAVDNSDDPARQMDIGRTDLGLVVPGEKILKITE